MEGEEDLSPNYIIESSRSESSISIPVESSYKKSVFQKFIYLKWAFQRIHHKKIVHKIMNNYTINTKTMTELNTDKNEITLLNYLDLDLSSQD